MPFQRPADRRHIVYRQAVTVHMAEQIAAARHQVLVIPHDLGEYSVMVVIGAIARDTFVCPVHRLVEMGDECIGVILQRISAERGCDTARRILIPAGVFGLPFAGICGIIVDFFLAAYRGTLVSRHGEFDMCAVMSEQMQGMGVMLIFLVLQ